MRNIARVVTPAVLAKGFEDALEEAGIREARVVLAYGSHDNSTSVTVYTEDRRPVRTVVEDYALLMSNDPVDALWAWIRDTVEKVKMEQEVRS